MEDLKEIEEMQKKARVEFFKAYGKLCSAYNLIPQEKYTTQIIDIAFEIATDKS